MTICWWLKVCLLAGAMTAACRYAGSLLVVAVSCCGADKK